MAAPARRRDEISGWSNLLDKGSVRKAQGPGLKAALILSVLCWG